jgi:hypothetical protein
MTNIKQQINSAYIRYKNSNFSVEQGADYRKLRTQFRYKQREKIKLSQKRVQKKLEILFRKKRRDFWK